jgi:NADH:quinone reductase (non-electrogenic)
VDVRLNSKIREITGDRVILEDGDELPSEVTVWAAGVSAPTGLSRWGLPQGQGGRIEVGPDLRVVGQDRIFATGDIALIEDQPLPQVRSRRADPEELLPRFGLHVHLSSWARQKGRKERPDG